MSIILHEEVQAFVEKNIFLENIDRVSEFTMAEEMVEPTRRVLEIITTEYTTYKYEFNLAMGFFVQNAHELMKDVLKTILLRANLREALRNQGTSNELDIYFTALYALSIIYKNTKNNDGLRELCSGIYPNVFGGYPLYHEVLSRWHKRNGQRISALNEDNNAIDRIARIDPAELNAGPRISYASTICDMLKDGCEVDPLYLKKAETFIDEAIKRNNQYQKYPFVKAKFIFLSQYRLGDDPALLIEAQQEAVQLIDEAQRLENLNLNNPQYNVDYENFKKYMAKTIAELRFPCTYADLDHKKAEIIASSSHKHCSTNGLLPPNPKLNDGDKYFFVCYSSQDYISVYCDLIELYKRKVHFMYDSRLANNIDWEKQVEDKINHDNCVGVVFYISENILLGDAVQNEIEIVINSKKPIFRLNLENSAPSKILIDFILKNGDKAYQHLTDRKMRLFLECFNDNGVFADKMKDGGEAGTKHLEAYISSLKDSYSNDIIGDK